MYKYKMKSLLPGIGNASIAYTLQNDHASPQRRHGGFDFLNLRQLLPSARQRLRLPHGSPSRKKGQGRRYLRRHPVGLPCHLLPSRCRPHQDWSSGSGPEHHPDDFLLVSRHAAYVSFDAGETYTDDEQMLGTSWLFIRLAAATTRTSGHICM
jgi:hypothetical protein